YLKAKAAALKALELDGSLAEAHTTLGGIKSDYEWDFAGTEVELRKALDLNPNYATAHHWYAQYLSQMGRHDEAITRIERAHELDPLSLIINSVVGDTYIKARQYDKAIAQLQKTIEMDKNFVRAHRYLAEAYIGKGMYREAISELETADTLTGEDAAKVAQRTKSRQEAYAAGGAPVVLGKHLEFLKKEATTENMSAYMIAGVYARLGDREQTIVWLEKAYHDHDSYLPYLKIDPPFDSIRADARVIDLMRRIGLP